MSQIAPEELFDAINAQQEGHTTPFFGVPDSLLKEFNSCVTASLPPTQNVIAANEGAALALAVGHHLATGRYACVYLQNSGTGNLVNPLLSIADVACYGTPALLLIGWRGEPGVKDEPQHAAQGRVQEALHGALGLDHAVLDTSSADAARAQVAAAFKHMRETRRSFALLVRTNAFSKYAGKGGKVAPAPLLALDALPAPRTVAAAGADLEREDAIKAVAAALEARCAVVSTTGKISRELYEHRVATGEGHARDFLTVGGMGHACSIALGIALAQPERQVLCLDGDGAILMHMGSLAICAQSGAARYVHVCLNNGAHDSVGGQPTVARSISLPHVALASGYGDAVRLSGAVDAAAIKDAIDTAFAKALENGRPSFVELIVKKGARAELGRPKESPSVNREVFMKFLSE